MLPKTPKELEAVAKECRKMTTKAALLSAGGGAIPAPGVDVAADIAILLKLIPQINRKFGLSKEQIDEYNDEFKILVFDLLKKGGARFAGRYITKELIIAILKRMGIRITAKQIAKYIPIIGQLVSGSLSFAAMIIVANSHINDCYEVAHELIEKNTSK
ncbi:MAG: hypothetical protein ACYC69_11120 [Thermodesulfovibrionales bacterium]